MCTPRQWMGLLVVFALCITVATTVLAAPPSHPHFSDQVIIKFKSNANQNDKDQVLNEMGATKLKGFGRINSALHRIEGLTVEEAIARYGTHPKVEYIEPNYIFEMDEIPNDPRFSELWGMLNTGQTGGTAGADIMATNAWDVFTGSSQVVVGVIDTGVDYLHPDLAANIYSNPGEIPGNGIDDDNNGFVDDTRGWDFINGDNDPMDDNGHGSHVSGTIGGRGNNGIGVAGVNWNVRIMPLKFLSAGGSGSSADAVSCIEYATMMGAKLTSNSWGGGGFSQALYDAIQDAQTAGSLFIAAAGNSSSNTDVSPHYPSSYDLDNIIAVAATDHNDNLASFSSYGATTVDIAAPGVDILSSVPGNAYALLSGTSMATPHVAGVTALVFGRFPAISGADVKNLILNFADPLPNLAGIVLTGGRLNAFFPIADPDTIPPGPITDLAATGTGSNWVDLAWTATGDDDETETASRYQMHYATFALNDLNFDTGTPAGNEPDPQTFGSPEAMRVNGLDFSTLYYFAVRAVDEFGNAGPVVNSASAMTLGAPDIAAAPLSLSETLLTGATSTQTLTLSNVGEGTLDFTVPTPVLLGIPQTVNATVEYAKGEADPRIGNPVLLGSGGPDGFGYRWFDSNDPFGPAYSWTDISGTGTVAIATGDDVGAGPFEVGFDFSFYGGDFNQFWVNSNGSISLSQTFSGYSNQPLPSGGGSAHMIAPFWDDLLLGTGSAVYYESNGSELIVQWDQINHYGSGGPYTFQLILGSDGSIVYQYETMSAPLNSATVGIQNGAKTDGLTVVFNTDYVESGLAVRLHAVPQWVTVSPAEGTIYAPGSQTLNATFDASGLLGGDYDGTIRILSNDPDEPEFDIPVALTVIGAPDLAVDPTSIDFGGVFIGATPTAEFTLQNIGTDMLTVSGLSVDNAAFSLDTANAMIPPRSAATVTVTFAPTAASAYTGTVTITSDDPDEPVLTVDLAGSGLVPPDFSVSPTSLTSNLFTGETETQFLTVTNAGGADFEFSLAVDFDVNVTVYDNVIEVGKEEVDTQPGILGAGGPDVFGYQWIDSDEPGGPVFDWTDISATGTPVFTANGDDQNRGPFAIGFSFPFYGNNFDDFRVCSNGWVSFTSTSTDLSNAPLPGTGAPENLLAGFHDDLLVDLSVGGNVYYENVGGRMIVQYDHVRRYGTSFQYTFQMSLYPNGNIVYQYLTMEGDRVDEATIGIQNDAQDDGLTVVYNDVYVHDAMAIKFASAAEWLSVNPTAGIVPPGGSLQLAANFNAADLFGGAYNATIRMTTNDPLAPTADIPATLNVTGAPDLAVSADAIDFGAVMIGYPSITNLLVYNAGTDNLVLTGFSVSHPDFSVNLTVPANIAPAGQLLLNVRYSPSSPGPGAATFAIASNDPDTPLYNINLSGTGIVAPIASAAPTSLFADLFTGEQNVQQVVLSNTGGSDLEFSVATEFVTEEIVVSTAVDLAKGEEDTRPGILGSGGPDTFGYSWIDSDDPAGPSFNWVEIAATGTPVFTATGDDRNFGPFPIGFDFEFYGNTFSDFRVCSNGWVSFTSSSTDLSNGSLPGTADPENLLAAFHDDLVVDLSLNGNVYYEVVDGKLVIQYDGVKRYGTTYLYTFQIILSPSGSIVYQYLSMGGDRLDEATIGIQNDLRDDGLTVVYNADYVHDGLAIRLGTTPEWLTASPASGIVPPGGSIPISVTFDATSLFGGDYEGLVKILSNDPANGVIDVAANMHVTGVPDLATDPTALDFGLVYVGFDGNLTLSVSNIGTDLLSVTGVTSTTAEFSVTPTVFDLDPFEAIDLTVTFAPADDGNKAGDLVFTSNDPDSPHSVPMTGLAQYPPDITVNPTEMVAAAPPGGSKVKTLQICNDGAVPLEWSLVDGEDPATVVQYPTLDIPKGELDTRPGILGSGGPDTFGYTWTDSDDPGGPVFDWVDISGIGTPFFNGYSDDGNRGPAPIGFDFPFYGTTFDEFRVCSNGWLSFTSTLSVYTNQPLPSSSSSTPENLLAVFWDDMVVDPTDGGEIFYYNDGSRLIVQFEVRRIATFDPPFYSMQAILYPNGQIVYQYNGLGATLNSATVGIQNGAKDDGLMVVFNDVYVHEGLAIRFASSPDWMSVTPTSGSVAPGECADVTVSFDASSLDTGDYTGSIEITSNDPDENPYVVPVTLHVGEIDVAGMEMTPNTLNATSNGRWIKSRFGLPAPYATEDIVVETVRFEGTVPADVASADLNGDAKFSFDRMAAEMILPEGEAVEVVVTGEIRDTIWFRAAGTMRVIRPTLTTPNGGEVIFAGGMVTIEWTDPDNHPVDAASIYMSPDNGLTWEPVATGLSGTSFDWLVPATLTEQARLRVFVDDSIGPMGWDTSDAVFQITDGVTGVDGGTPRVYALGQNVPNPFNPSTIISFALPKAGKTELQIYDLRGRVVRTLLSKDMPVGHHTVTWRGKDDHGRQVASGVYFYQIRSGDFEARHRMVLLK